MNEFFTWTLLATFAGAVTATAILTQFVKDALSRVPTQIVSYIISLLILCVATAATGGASDWTGWAILPLNAVLVSLSANGTCSAVQRVTDNNKKY